MQARLIFVLMLLISFGSIGAVIFTPGLPEIASYFMVNNQVAASTVTYYLMGYTVGQLIYGPLANRFGSQTTIKIGAYLAIIGSVGCILSYPLHSFILLLFARLVMALGCACGLKMTFTLANKLFKHNESARIMSLLTCAFAITPGLGVFLGGAVVESFNWTAPFYLMVLYACAILILAKQLPEIYSIRDCAALKLSNIANGYLCQFKDGSVVLGGLLVGLGSCVVYVFAALSPFIAINSMHLTPSDYGLYNFIPCIGILGGSLSSNALGKIWLPTQSLKFGLSISLSGDILLLLMLHLYKHQAVSLFMPMVVIYFGLSFIFGNSAALAIKNAIDKSNASAVMSFINMGSAFLTVTILSLFSVSHPVVLPVIYLVLLGLGVIWYLLLTKLSNTE